MLCRRAEMGEPTSDGSSQDLAFYEEVLEACPRFPMPSSVCRIPAYSSFLPGRLAPNGWRVLLGFLALWRNVHSKNASPSCKDFFAAYTSHENPTPKRGWYHFPLRARKLITGLCSNCHSWRTDFCL
ncbi:unnamed protein product [Ilex paraguariensis]|uniref:Uncharacterized protein n=1 Tax=Ilex paraguariensis TaxID=185542 RepID=A0ABC8V2L4_9AQUA